MYAAKERIKLLILRDFHEILGVERWKKSLIIDDILRNFCEVRKLCNNIRAESGVAVWDLSSEKRLINWLKTWWLQLIDNHSIYRFYWFFSLQILIDSSPGFQPSTFDRNSLTGRIVTMRVVEGAETVVVSGRVPETVSRGEGADSSFESVSSLSSEWQVW